MSNARACLEALQRYGVVKFWTGHAFVWDVATHDNEGHAGSLIFASEQDANAYVAALGAVVAAQQAAITLPRDVAQALDDYQCQRFWEIYRRERGEP
jgi:hypothetical protein